MLKIEGLTKTYTGKRGKKHEVTCAVDELSLHVRAGEIYGFIGHNGAGKTTTLRAAAGVLAFDSGEIFVDGISIRENALECKRHFSYVPDNPELYDNLSGFKYLKFIADIYGIEPALRKQRIDRYTGEFEITDRLGDEIGSYSHGMKQKLALTAALLHAPRLLMLDEPFVGLDPKAAATLKGYMREICDAGGAIFFSTHVLDVAEKLCSRVAIIKQGKLVVEGDMDAVKGNESLEQIFLELN